MAEFKNILLSEITPDPNQPRRLFDEDAMIDLIASVREKGILQPILVRPNNEGKGFTLVCGERRFRAALSVNAGNKTRDSIPAMIRELSDEETFELQIIENLQRKDVHPMEEAIAYKTYQDKKKVTIEELSAKFAKSKEYIAQRLSFNTLIKEFQTDFYSGLMLIGHAVLLARLTPADQKELLPDIRSHHHKDGISYDTIDEVKERIEDEIMHELGSAPFDKKDEKLIPKAGSCLLCPKRSGSGLLFADMKEKDRCFDAKCYSAKKKAHLIKAVEDAVITADMPLIAGMGGRPDKEVEKLIAGHKIKVLEEYDDFREASASTPGAVKALCVSGHRSGKTMFVKLVGKSATAAPAKKSDGQPATVTAKEIDDEISRIQAREKRSKELDDVKMWDNLKGHFSPGNNSTFFKGAAFTETEREAIAQSLYNKLEYSSRDDFKKTFKIKGANIGVIPQDTLQQMIRYFMLSVLPPTVIYNGLTPDAVLSIKIADEYFPAVLKDVRDTQNAAAAKRNERVAKRIADLRIQKKNLTAKAPPAKPPAKKPADNKVDTPPPQPKRKSKVT